MRSRGWLRLPLLLLCLAASVHAQGVPDPGSLRERLARLRADAESIPTVRTAIDQAELALSRAETARATSDGKAAERALRIAEAATTLAERRSDLARERRLSVLVAERKRHVQAETALAREALAAQRARAASGAAKESR